MEYLIVKILKISEDNIRLLKKQKIATCVKYLKQERLLNKIFDYLLKIFNKYLMINERV